MLLASFVGRLSDKLGGERQLYAGEAYFKGDYVWASVLKYKQVPFH